jgi:S-adenosylmethionine-diacylglycerol 3-amino-3-carboxypropyl transferase
LGCRPEEILKAKTMDEQATIYSKQIDRFFDSGLIKFVGKLPVTMFGLGIPPQQYDELKQDLEHGRTVIDIYRDRVATARVRLPDRRLTTLHGRLSQDDTTQDHRRAIPDYLKGREFRNTYRTSGSRQNRRRICDG